MKILLFIFLPAFLFSHGLPFSQTFDFFPIQDGNIWVYSSAISSPSDNYFFVKIIKKENLFYTMNYFGSGENFEVTKKGNEIFFSTEKEKFLIYEFEKGSIWHIPDTLSINTPCVAGSYIGVAESEITYSTPAGIFNNCFRILWDNPCKDAGIVEEIFCPDVGLIKRVENRIFGTFSYELIYAYVNGITYGYPSLSINSGVSPEFIFNENCIKIELKNNTNKELNLIFPTSQIFDIILENENGEILYQWSYGQSFLQVITNKVIAPYDNFEISVFVSFPDLGKGVYYLKTIIPVTQINSINTKKPLINYFPIFKY